MGDLPAPVGKTNLSGQLAFSLQPSRQIFSVTELNRSVQEVFANNFAHIWVSGEISSYRISPAGHHYFCLKDSESQLKCVVFKGTARFLRLKLHDGMAIAAQGNLDLYQVRGEFQLLIDRIELQGTGSLQLAFENLKTQLEAEGLFQLNRKRQLPRFPRRIGLVTSPSGAVLQDMLHVLSRRFPGLHIRLYPVAVQGEGSAEQIGAALEFFSKSSWAEVVILARGGGSLEDLWTFNEERVARAIASASVPIISAVGHETDFTIADFVSDHRAPTPSAAAEIVVVTRESILSILDESATRMVRALRYRLLFLHRAVDGRSGDRGLNQMRRAITSRMQRLDEVDLRSQRLQKRQISDLGQRLTQLTRRLAEANLPLRFSRNRHRQDLLAEQLVKRWRSGFWQRRQRLDIASSHLAQLSPLAVLSRGYAIVETPTRQILRASSEARPEEELTIRLHSGKVKAIVTEIEAAQQEDASYN